VSRIVDDTAPTKTCLSYVCVGFLRGAAHGNVGTFLSDDVIAVQRTRIIAQSRSPRTTPTPVSMMTGHFVVGLLQNKEDTKLMAITLSFLNRFSKFFHRQTQ